MIAYPFCLFFFFSLGQGCLVTFAVDITLLLHYTLLQRTLHSLPQKGGRMAGVSFGTFLIFGLSLLVHLLSVLRLVLAAFTDGGFKLSPSSCGVDGVRMHAYIHTCRSMRLAWLSSLSRLGTGLRSEDSLQLRFALLWFSCVLCLLGVRLGFRWLD